MVYYGFRITDAEQSDPEVWQLNPHEDKWYFDCKRMTSFLLKMACWQAVCGGVPHSAKGHISLQQYAELETEYERIDFGRPDLEYDEQAFQKDGLIVSAFPSQGRRIVFCGSNSRKKVRQTASRLGLEIL